MTTALLTRLHTAFTLSLLAIFLCGAMATDGCGKKTTVINAEMGDANAKLLAEQQAQINELKAKDLERTEQLKAIAANAYGITVGTNHIKEESKGKDVVVAENNLIKQVTGEPTVEKKNEADARTLSILQADFAAQKILYGKAQSEIDATKKIITEKDAEIQKRDLAFTALAAEAKKERDTSAVALKTAVDSYEAKIKEINDANAKKERALWVNVLRFGGFGVILLGVAALALTQGQALIQGLILIGSGAAIIAIGVAINIVISQAWFPIVATIIGLLVVAAIGWFVWHQFDINKFARKSEAVFNDIKTEAQSLSEAGVAGAKELSAAIEPHLKYRFGSLTKLDQRFKKSGLDEPKTP